MDPAATKTLQVVRGGDEQSDQAVVLQRVEGSGSKSMKVELGLELRPSREESHPSSEGGQPWLRISATSCAERVFM